MKRKKTSDYIITVLLAALFNTLENNGGFLDFYDMALQKGSRKKLKYKYQCNGFNLVTLKLLGKNPSHNHAASRQLQKGEMLEFYLPGDIIRIPLQLHSGVIYILF